MESYSIATFIGQTKKFNLKFLDYTTLSSITGHTNKNTLYKIIQRLIKNGLVSRIGTSSKYVIHHRDYTEFELANFVYSPSYIALESALSHHGILSQFSYSIVSITTNKSKRFVFDDREYIYSHISPNLFWGYEKQGTFLISTPEKSLIDSVYFNLKGYTSFDFGEFDLSSVNIERLKSQILEIANPQLVKKIQEVAYAQQ
ncbi:MAG: hypothetical protein Q8P72_06870 [Candidatus Roizmanbacteria bacterium]|nr:hypothetical protein [Candidatus Roizmanbacteria bacterium]